VLGGEGPGGNVRIPVFYIDSTSVMSVDLCGPCYNICSTIVAAVHFVIRTIMYYTNKLCCNTWIAIEQTVPTRPASSARPSVFCDCSVRRRSIHV